VSRELKLPSLNKILIAGNCTADPEVRYTQSGAAVTNFRIASTRYYRDRGGDSSEWKEDTCFVNVVTWGQLAERMGDQLKKGSAVLVEGRLQSRTWETEDGQKRSTIEINADRVQTLDRRGGGEGGAPAYAGGRSREGSGGGDMDSDDLPF
jgi:single-strand DNA-binding protein